MREAFQVPKMAAQTAEAGAVEDVDAMEAPRQSLLEVVQEKLAEKGLVSYHTTHHLRLPIAATPLSACSA